MCGGEGLAIKVGNPIKDLVVTRHYEASLIAVKGMADVQFRPITVEMVCKVRWLYDVAQEEGFPPLLTPNSVPLAAEGITDSHAPIRVI